MFFFKFLLSLSWRRPLSYKNQSIDFLRKLMDWFIYDIGHRRERLKMGKKWRKMTTLFPRCLTLFSSTLKNTTLLQRCSMTLCDVATSYQPKNNVEPRLKCLLGIHACIYRKKSVIWRHQFHPSIFYGIFIVSREHLKRSICQGHCLFHNICCTYSLQQAVCGWFEEIWRVRVF